MESWIAFGGVLISTGGAFVIAWITTRKPSDLRQAEWLSALIDGMPIGPERDMASDLRDGLVSRWSVLCLYPLTRRQRRRRGLGVAMLSGYVAMVVSFSASIGLSRTASSAPWGHGTSQVLSFILIVLGLVFFFMVMLSLVAYLLIGEAKTGELAMRRRVAQQIYGLRDDPWTKFKTVAEEHETPEQARPRE